MLDIDSRRPCALLLALLLAACTDKDNDGTNGVTDTKAQSTGPQATATTDVTATDTTDASATTPGPTTDATTDAPAAGCECAASDPCSMPLCGLIAFDENNGDSEGIDSDFGVEATLTCALEALRDGKAGQIIWYYDFHDGQFQEYGSFDLFGDGTARRTVAGVEGSCVYLSEDVSVGPLQDAQVYNDCLAEFDTSTRFNCVRGAVPSSTDVCQVGELNCRGV